MLTGCAEQNAAEPADAANAAGGAQAAQTETPSGDGWERFITYDEAGALELFVKAAAPGEEESFSYPWGEYDAPLEVAEAEGSEAAGELPAAEDPETLRQKALESLSPELCQAAEEAMLEEQARQETAGAQDTYELPADWNAPSNQPELGGRLEFVSGDTAVGVALSEYCVDQDTAFTLMPVKSTELPEEFIKGGFLLCGADREASVSLGDYAVVTFVTKEDPGGDVVIKSLGHGGELEYTPTQVTKLGDTYRIAGAVTHFSTVGYGPAELSGSADAELQRLSQKLAEEAARQAEKVRLDEKWGKEYAERSHVRVITFDEILFTTTVMGDPCQLHLRAKLVEQPDKVNAASGGLESTFMGKVWIKAYFLNPGAGFGDMYYLCSSATLEDPLLWDASANGKGTHTAAANFGMTTIAGSKGVAYGIGEYNFSGRGYSMQSVWEVNPANGSVKVTFPSFQGFSEKTFVTGRLSEVTKKQAAKKLKWFLD